jgi:hypothetical protein
MVIEMLASVFDGGFGVHKIILVFGEHDSTCGSGEW